MCSVGDPERPRVRQEGREGRKKGKELARTCSGWERGSERGRLGVFPYLCFILKKTNNIL